MMGVPGHSVPGQVVIVLAVLTVGLAVRMTLARAWEVGQPTTRGHCCHRKEQASVQDREGYGELHGPECLKDLVLWAMTGKPASGLGAIRFPVNEFKWETLGLRTPSR